MSGNSRGKRDSALPNGEPALTSARRAATRLRWRSSSASSVSAVRARSSGNPEVTSPANCRVQTVSVVLLGSVVAYARSLRRISFNAATAALASALYVAAVLGMLPIVDGQTLAISLALVTLGVSVVLTYLLFAVLGFFKRQKVRQQLLVALGGVLLAALGSGWFLKTTGFLVVATTMAFLLGLLALAAAFKSALRGDRLAWAVTGAICSMLVALAGLSLIAIDRANASWTLHAVSAMAATLYLATMASVLWSRYFYLIELNKIMAYGPSYDPVTRMRSHAETGQMVKSVFKSFRDKPQPLGIVVLTIANFYALEQLYGAPAVNQALFVCAERLRRIVPSHVQMGRLGDEGFALVMPNCTDSASLVEMAHTVEASLRRSVALNTSREAISFETDNTVWVAKIGVAVLMVSNPEVSGTDAIAMGLRMSRTAISYTSRIAWFDHSSGETVELPDARLL